MRNLVPIILFLFILTKTFGQDSSRSVSYDAGVNLNYTGVKSPDFTLPVGAGVTVTATLDKFSKLKPAIELNAVGFPEYELTFNNTNNGAGTEHAYGIFNLLIGTKYKLSRLSKISLMTGPSLNTVENKLQVGLRPSFEFNFKSDKFTLQLYYLKIFNSGIINGYAGTAILFKIR